MRKRWVEVTVQNSTVKFWWGKVEEFWIEFRKVETDISLARGWRDYKVEYANLGRNIIRLRFLAGNANKVDWWRRKALETKANFNFAIR